MIAEGLELTVGPGIENPVPTVGVRRLGLVLGHVPRGLDLGDQRIFVLVGRVLGLETLELEVGRELFRVPVPVRGNDVVIPVLLDELLQVSAVGGGRVGDVVVREPSLQFRLVPLVVSCRTIPSACVSENRRRHGSSVGQELAPLDTIASRAEPSGPRRAMGRGCTYRLW